MEVGHVTALDTLIKGLNSKQREAVLTTEGPVLIAAGAGSGKTRVLTHRIAYLIQERQVNPWNILAITFTNKAATEMRERVQRLVGEEASSIWVATFHAMCARILRREIETLGYAKNFTIIDQGEQQTLMKQVLRDLNLDSDQYNYKDLLWVIDAAKNQGYLPDDFLASDSGYIHEIHANIYRNYQKRLKAANALDFNDLILLTVRLLEQNPTIRQFYQQKFQYIHVDEYQDTNHSQYRLVQLLAGLLKNICVVGDADQSIYGWRGANMANILNFEQDYPQAKVILLEQNYRSTQTILKAANSVIENNLQRKDKQLWSDGQVGEKIQIYSADSDLEEADFVTRTIRHLRDQEGANYSQVAVLYRTQAQSRGLEEALLRSNMPYKVVGGLKFYARKEIQDTLAYLRLLDNPHDNLSLNRIINVPKRGIGATTVTKLAEFADSLGVSWFEAIGRLHFSNFSASVQKKLLDFAQLIESLRQQVPFLPLRDLTEEVWDKTGYLKSLKEEGTVEAANRLENLEEFASVVTQFDQTEREAILEQDPDYLAQTQGQEEVALAPLTQFLTDVSLMTDADNQEETLDQVTLMTLHAAKGLEFPYVFMVGMEEGLFPLRRASENPDELEEERRLAYVGMTRAERALYLTASKRRLQYGRTVTNPPSRFLDEIQPDLVEWLGSGRQSSAYGQSSWKQTWSDSPSSWTGLHHQPTVNVAPSRTIRKQEAGDRRLKNQAALRHKGPVAGASTSASGAGQTWQVGDKVLHKTFGQGTIVKVAKAGKDQLLSVAFASQGIKDLMAAYAPLTKANE